MVTTLNEIVQLKNSRFGQPHPRHGLSLLWWFADECVEIDNGRMIAQYDPEDGGFGFHEFHNAEGIFPKNGLTYYEVGNLHHGDSLPDYVTRYYDEDSPVSNTDRIVVSIDSDEDDGDIFFDKVYVTHHSNQVDFAQNCTYRISQGLIRTIQNLNRGEFIRQVLIRRRSRRR